MSNNGPVHVLKPILVCQPVVHLQRDQYRPSPLFGLSLTDRPEKWLKNMERSSTGYDAENMDRSTIGTLLISCCVLLIVVF